MMSVKRSIIHLKGETNFVTYLSGKCSILEKNYRIHLIPMRYFYGVQFLNKSVKSSVIFHQFFQPAEKTFKSQIQILK